MQTSQSNSTRKKAMLLMALCACLWSISGIFIKWISWSPFLIAGGRSLISAAVLGLFMTVSRIGIQVCRSSICAGISLGVSFLCFVSANKLTTAANAIVLQYTSPIFILIISALFLHQQIKKREAAVVCAAAAGILLFFLDQLSPGNIGGQFLRDSGRVLPVNYVRIDRSCRKQRFDSHERDSFRPYIYCTCGDSRWSSLYCFHFHPGDLPHPDSGDFPAGNPLHTLRDRGQRLLSSGLLTHWNAGASA